MKKLSEEYREGTRNDGIIDNVFSSFFTSKQRTMQTRISNFFDQLPGDKKRLAINFRNFAFAVFSRYHSQTFDGDDGYQGYWDLRFVRCEPDSSIDKDLPLKNPTAISGPIARAFMNWYLNSIDSTEDPLYVYENSLQATGKKMSGEDYENLIFILYGHQRDKEDVNRLKYVKHVSFYLQQWSQIVESKDKWKMRREGEGEEVEFQDILLKNFTSEIELDDIDLIPNRVVIHIPLPGHPHIDGVATFLVEKSVFERVVCGEKGKEREEEEEEKDEEDRTGIIRPETVLTYENKGYVRVLVCFQITRSTPCSHTPSKRADFFSSKDNLFLACSKTCNNWARIDPVQYQVRINELSPNFAKYEAFFNWIVPTCAFPKNEKLPNVYGEHGTNSSPLSSLSLRQAVISPKIINDMFKSLM